MISFTYKKIYQTILKLKKMFKELLTITLIHYKILLKYSENSKEKLCIQLYNSLPN